MHWQFTGPITVQGLVTCFLVGIVIGKILHRATLRLPFSSGMIWPLADHCRKCWQPLPWLNAIPLLGYFLVGGRCKHCQQRIGIRAVILPILLGLMYMGIYFFYMKDAAWVFPFSTYNYLPDTRLALVIYHSILFTLLLLATLTDLDWMLIPDSITIPGMIIGVVLGTFWYVELHPISLWRPPDANPMANPPIVAPAWLTVHGWKTFISNWGGGQWGGSEQGMAWRYWILDYYHLNWNKVIGFSTSIVGLIAGGAVVWAVRALFTFLLGKEAMGFGDVTLMAMVGSFVGWQIAVLAFFLAPFSAVIFGLISWLFLGKKMIPFGPYLSLSTCALVIVLRPIWDRLFFIQVFWEASDYIAISLGVMTGLAVIGTMSQWMKRFFGRVVRTAPTEVQTPRAVRARFTPYRT